MKSASNATFIPLNKRVIVVERGQTSSLCDFDGPPAFRVPNTDLRFDEKKYVDTMERLLKSIELDCELGYDRTGCYASLWDRAYYAAMTLFPEGTDAAWNLMADYVTREE